MSCSSQNSHSADNAEMNEVLSFVSTGNASPILHEIKHALARLLDSGETTVIDLGAIPFAPGDERELDAVLGTGDISAQLNVLGESRVVETQVSGVWRVDHFDEDGNTQARFIEVTIMPDILKSQREDVETGLEVLGERLEELEDKH